MTASNVPLVWGVSGLYNLPNVFAMACVIVLMLMLQQRHPQLRIQTWNAALAIIFLNQLLWFVPGTPTWLGTANHVFRLSAELLVGAIFLLFDRTHDAGQAKRRRFILANLGPLLALQILYGLGVRSAAPYLVCAAAGLFILLVAAKRHHPSRELSFGCLLLWLYVATAASNGHFRTAAYGAAGLVFAAAAAHLQRQFRPSQIGRVTVVAGMSIWSASMLIHAWIMAHPLFNKVAEQTWAMQKFIVSFGMLIVLFEEEALENRQMALHDPLTGLANRRQLEHFLEAGVASGAVEILLCDLDGFKGVNDQLGHAAGDEVLQTMAERFNKLCVAGEMVARIGGDEFVLVAPGALAARIPRIQEIISMPVSLDKGQAHVGCSIGFANFPADAIGLDDGEAVSQLIQIADRRMYIAKFSQREDRRGRAARPLASELVV